METYKPKKTYIKVSDGGSHYIDTVEAAKDTLDYMVECCNDSGKLDGYKFSTVELTEEEFNNLPDFTGF